tara:strand:- start:112 stop:750 length:639 start_codon:yes stop_codon:yes gene_type:complete
MSGFTNIKVGIINSNIHNIHNIYRTCSEVGFKTSIINPSEKKLKYDLLILPGVGSFKSGMNYLNKYDFKEKIKNFLLNQNKILFGICLGMQLLFEESEEFVNTEGLGLIEGKVIKLKKTNKFKVPHIGWNKIIIKKKNKLISSHYKNKMFYFVHSYFCKPDNKEDILTYTNCGEYNFVSSILKKNVIATQFHPEKSGNQGINLIKDIKKYIN